MASKIIILNPYVFHLVVDNSKKKSRCSANILIFLEMYLHTISLIWSKFDAKFSFCSLTVKEQKWVILKDRFYPQLGKNICWKV